MIAFNLYKTFDFGHAPQLLLSRGPRLKLPQKELTAYLFQVLSEIYSRLKVYKGVAHVLSNLPNGSAIEFANLQTDRKLACQTITQNEIRGQWSYHILHHIFLHCKAELNGIC